MYCGKYDNEVWAWIEGESVQQTSACMQGSIMRIYDDADDDNHDDDDDDDGGDDDQETCLCISKAQGPNQM